MSRDEEVYAAVVDVPVADRAAFLDRACEGDPALRARVEALLIANDEAEEFFTLPPVPRPALAPEEKPGDRIGRYKLLQKIGEGGCGVVYMAKHRATAPAQLSVLMRGDLDWIVMRALEKNRTRRYETASGLAADIGRHLNNEPVVARPPSVAYRSQKFAARNKYPIMGTAAAVVSLCAGLALSKIAFRANVRGVPATAAEQSAGERPSENAREILAGLGQVPSDVVASRKLPLADASWVMTISPDGRFIAYMDQEWSPVFIYETASAKTWELVKASTLTSWYVVFSPDASQVAYDMSGTSLWVAKIDGSDARELYKPDGNKNKISIVAWSPATGQVLARLQDSAQNISTLVSLDPKTREMKEILPSAGNSELSLSSDGRYLAQRIGRKVTIVDLVSRQEKLLVDDHVTQLVGWSHHDSEFLFSSDRTGAPSLWTIAVKSGKPSGEPRFVKEYADEATVAGVTHDGSIYYIERRNSGNVILVSANFETGEIMGEPRLVTDRFPGVQTTPVWSRDGQKLLLAIKGRQSRFVAVSVESGQQQDFPVATIFDRVRQYSWSKDGKFLLVAARKLSSSGGPTGIHRFEPASGKVETVVTQKSQEWLAHPRLSPDEKSLYYTRRRFVQAADGSRNATDCIVRRDLRSNQEEIVYQPAGKANMWSSFELSPDSSRLAIVATDEGKKEEFVVALKVLTLSGGQKEVIRMAPRENVSSLAWTPDGKRLVYTKETPSKEKKGPAQTAIWSTAVDSGESVKLKFSQSALGAFAVNPDGRQIAFRTGSIGDTVDVWVMKGLMPKPVALKDGAQSKVIAQSPPAETKTHIPLGELSGPNQSILDRKFGLSATLPTGWTIKSANRTITWGNHIEFAPPDAPDDTRAFVNYRATRPGELATFHGEAWTNGGAQNPPPPPTLILGCAQLRKDWSGRGARDIRITSIVPRALSREPSENSRRRAGWPTTPITARTGPTIGR